MQTIRIIHQRFLVKDPGKTQLGKTCERESDFIDEQNLEKYNLQQITYLYKSLRFGICANNPAVRTATKL